MNSKDFNTNKIKLCNNKKREKCSTQNMCKSYRNNATTVG